MNICFTIFGSCALYSGSLEVEQKATEECVVIVTRLMELNNVTEEAQVVHRQELQEKLSTLDNQFPTLNFLLLLCWVTYVEIKVAYVYIGEPGCPYCPGI
jgi:hypothetical protein